MLTFEEADRRPLDTSDLCHTRKAFSESQSREREEADEQISGVSTELLIDWRAFDRVYDDDDEEEKDGIGMCSTKQKAAVKHCEKKQESLND